MKNHSWEEAAFRVCGFALLELSRMEPDHWVCTVNVKLHNHSPLRTVCCLLWSTLMPSLHIITAWLGWQRLIRLLCWTCVFGVKQLLLLSVCSSNTRLVLQSHSMAALSRSHVSVSIPDINLLHRTKELHLHTQPSSALNTETITATFIKSFLDLSMKKPAEPVHDLIFRLILII